MGGTEIVSGKEKEVEKINEVKKGVQKRAKNPKWKEKRGGKNKRGRFLSKNPIFCPRNFRIALQKESLNLYFLSCGAKTNNNYLNKFWMPTEILGGKKKEVERIQEVNMGGKKRAKNPKWKKKEVEKKKEDPLY